MSILYRCDDCCEVIGDINGGVVYDCSKVVQEKFGFDHICEHYLKSEDLYLDINGNVAIVMHKD